MLTYLALFAIAIGIFGGPFVVTKIVSDDETGATPWIIIAAMCVLIVSFELSFSGILHLTGRL